MDTCTLDSIGILQSIRDICLGSCFWQISQDNCDIECVLHFCICGDQIFVTLGQFSTFHFPQEISPKLSGNAPAIEIQKYLSIEIESGVTFLLVTNRGTPKVAPGLVL